MTDFMPDRPDLGHVVNPARTTTDGAVADWDPVPAERNLTVLAAAAKHDVIDVGPGAGRGCEAQRVAAAKEPPGERRRRPGHPRTSPETSDRRWDAIRCDGRLEPIKINWGGRPA